MPNIIEGILTFEKNSTPILWEIPFDKSKNYYKIPNAWIKQFNLKNGARLNCEIQKGKVVYLHSVCDQNPVQFKKRKKFNTLVASNPTIRFNFSKSEYISLRLLDKIAPIGKGSRALIVSPPKAGKTTLLENLAKELVENQKQKNVIVLLIHERPEEVTRFRYQTKAKVYHSSMDFDPQSHRKLSDLMIENIKLEVECGNDITILLDSLTRLGRAYNLNNNSGGRTMSGGLGSNALEIPRKLFGLARNIEGGGSCTIISTILTDTGSRMDQMIFQEFKGTGNCDIILDRSLAEERIFPALNIRESGTRKENLLFTPKEMQEVNELRRKVFKMDNAKAIEYLKSIYT